MLLRCCAITVVLLSAAQAFVISTPSRATLTATFSSISTSASGVDVIARPGTVCRVSPASRCHRRRHRAVNPTLATKHSDANQHERQDRGALAIPAEAREASHEREHVSDILGKSMPAADPRLPAFLGATAAAAGIALHPDVVHAADAFANGPQVSLVLSQLMANPLAAFAANPEWTRYAFMMPVGVLVATCAQTAGIGGAAIMGPFFLLGLPLLGPEYPLHGVAASVATAILSEAFGFSSGLFGYFRRGLIDLGSAVPFIVASLPACLLGAVIVPYADDRALKALYAVFMLGLSAYLLFDEQGRDLRQQSKMNYGGLVAVGLHVAVSGYLSFHGTSCHLVHQSMCHISESLEPEECSIEELESGEVRAICTTEGKEYIYRKPVFGTQSGLSTAFGGLMTGMLGVGIGEVVIPQLVKKNGVPLPVAAGTSVLVVFLNAVVAAGTQIGGILAQGGDIVPWNLIAFIVPGVVIGGQLAPRMQGRLSQRTMEKILAGVFGAVGLTFATISVESLLAIASVSATVPLELVQ